MNDPRDPRDMPGPDIEQKIEVFEGTHLAASLGCLAIISIIVFSILWWTTR